MRKLFVLALLIVATASAFAEDGTIRFFTFNANPDLGQTFLPANLGGGGPGPNYFGQLYWSDTTNGTYAALGTTQPFGASPTNQYVNNGVFSVPGRSAGVDLFFKMYIWNATAGATYEAALGSPNLIASGKTIAKSHTLGGLDDDFIFFTTQNFNDFPNLTLSPAGIVPPLPPISFSYSSNNLVLSWSIGVLQSATNVTGAYLDVPGASNPYTNNTTSAPRRFFRLRN